MGFKLTEAGMDAVIAEISDEYAVYAPVRYKSGGRFSDTDCVRYGQVQSMAEVVFDEKSEWSFKEVLLPISETLFFFTEDTVKEKAAPAKGALVFLRSCDLHAVKRLDEMYLNNGKPDYYYKRLRDRITFVLMGCLQAFESCFCVDMGTNVSDNYDLSIDQEGEGYVLDVKNAAWREVIAAQAQEECPVVPESVTETLTRVTIPENLDARVIKSTIWDEYDKRCINCGRCNFVCPTCTCTTMQDLYYSENGRVGERRRIPASCMVDGFCDVAGGGTYRRKNGERMRFKVLHKVLDFRKRSGYNMCVGCGRCDDVCPEYISYSNCINKLEGAMAEVTK
jgi:anaerobic sulfite reductase subunit A